ncbi:hypothetical protein [Shewanella atlantica]|uniref:Capsule biosynthesis protein n=1 Tax=Shewanella atlantica TaxID=271099 RepID=A0A431WAK6_9GAMM|nr:hypothetical protein [Shewanella atlantica]RTR32530.1 hypothetical protein EKG39_09110 [Shewanella atlantica]
MKNCGRIALQEKLCELDFFGVNVWFALRDVIPTKSSVQSKIKNREKIKFIYLLKLFISSIYLLKNLRCHKVLIISDPGSRVEFTTGKIDQLYDRYLDGVHNRSEHLLFEIPKLGVNFNDVKSYSADLVVPGILIYILEFIGFIGLSFSLNKRRKLRGLSTTVLDRIKNNGGEFSEKRISRTIIERRISTFYAKKLAAAWLFKIIRPKGLVVKSSYSPTCLSMLQEAKILGINTAEMQHSHIYRSHPGYTYDKHELVVFKNQYQPTQFFVFSEYYRTLLSLLGWESQIKVVGNPYYETFKKYGADVNYKFDLLIISQYNLTREIIEWLQAELPANPTITICIKCHPRSNEEFLAYTSAFSNNKNIIIARVGSIFGYIQKAKFIAGIYSSGLVDAISCGHKPYVLPIEGSALMKELEDDKQLIYITKLSEITMNV